MSGPTESSIRTRRKCQECHSYTCVLRKKCAVATVPTLHSCPRRCAGLATCAATAGTQPQTCRDSIAAFQATLRWCRRMIGPAVRF